MKQLVAVFMLLVGIFAMSVGKAEKMESFELESQTGVTVLIQEASQEKTFTLVESKYSISNVCFNFNSKEHKFNSNLYGLEFNPMTAKKKRVKARPKREKSYEVHFVHLNYYNDLRRVLV